jgi:hypothetical protein
LASRIDKRKKAYQYIYQKLHESVYKPSYNTAELPDVSTVIPLAEIDKLREGITDPSEALIVALKTLLHHTTSESEIEEILVKPFLLKSRSFK